MDRISQAVSSRCFAGSLPSLLLSCQEMLPDECLTGIAVFDIISGSENRNSSLYLEEEIMKSSWTDLVDSIVTDNPSNLTSDVLLGEVEEMAENCKKAIKANEEALEV